LNLSKESRIFRKTLAMPQRYAVLLLGLLLHFAPCCLHAQNASALYLEGGAGASFFSLYTDFRYSLHYNGTSRSSSHTQALHPASALNAHLGTQWEWKDRWHLKARICYSQGEALDNPDGLTHQLSFPIYTRLSTASPRTFRIGWSEALILFAPRHGYHWEWQFGSGLSYGVWWQEYRSGFEYDLDRDIYRVERRTRAWASSLGLPLYLQLQYFVDQHFKFGLSAQTNFFFSGDTQAGLQASLAYRLH
jgi:hypothetical protein